MSARHKFLLASSLTVCAVAIALALSYQAPSAEQQQAEFITQFYKNYLSRNWRGRSNSLPIGYFYSKEADELITRNTLLCETLSRGDEICGYGADGDVFLNAQEIDADLTFTNAHFEAKASNKNTIDVSFNVYPALGKDYDRKIRYVFVKEGTGWRVDDVFFDDNGRFPVNLSMRYEINEENENVLARARDIVEVARWVSIYLSQSDMLARAERFVTNPVQICGARGTCESVTKRTGDVKLRDTMEALHQAYHIDGAEAIVDFSEFIPKKILAVEGKTVQVGALDFTFHDNAWWITKIDLGRLGRLVPLPRQHVSH